MDLSQLKIAGDCHADAATLEKIKEDEIDLLKFGLKWLKWLKGLSSLQSFYTDKKGGIKDG